MKQKIKIILILVGILIAIEVFLIFSIPSPRIIIAETIVIEDGDTIASIAVEYDVSEEALLEVNPLYESDIRFFKVGAIINIPGI